MRLAFFINVLLQGLALLAGFATTRAASIDDFIPLTYENGTDSIPYRLFIPTNYSAATNYPLVLFLHGSGERGTNNDTQFNENGALVFITNQTQYPSFMVAPECSPDDRWTNSNIRELLFDLVGSLQQEFSIDADRIYITGLSMGGEGTWDQIVNYPGFYAAAVSMSAGYMGTAPITNLANIPIWDFHAANDDVNSVDYSRGGVAAARQLGDRVVYTEYADGFHNIWDTAYATPILMDWIYSQRRGVRSALPPMLDIMAPTNQSVYVDFADGTPIQISGVASDGSAGPDSVTWTNFQNGMATAGGNASGTTAWQANDPAPDLNATNLLIVTGTGTSWSDDLGGQTTFNDALKILSPAAAGYFAFSRVEQTGGNISLTWYSVSNQTYRIEYCTNLAVNAWESLPGDVTATNTTATQTDFTPDDNQRFYRIMLVP
jgi:poly(3-hydroxybutyrate) depolymerase